MQKYPKPVRKCSVGIQKNSEKKVNPWDSTKAQPQEKPKLKERHEKKCPNRLFYVNKWK